MYSDPFHVTGDRFRHVGGLYSLYMGGGAF